MFTGDGQVRLPVRVECLPAPLMHGTGPAKPALGIIARQHPGEVVGSWAMQAYTWPKETSNG
eukprot:5012027-Amphidinium_carterae.2